MRNDSGNFTTSQCCGVVPICNTGSSTSFALLSSTFHLKITSGTQIMSVTCLAGPAAAPSAPFAASNRAISLLLIACIIRQMFPRLPRAFPVVFQVFSCASLLFGLVDTVITGGLGALCLAPYSTLGPGFLLAPGAMTIAMDNVASFAAFCCVHVRE